GGRMVASVTAVLKRFTTAWATQLPPEVIIAACEEAGYTKDLNLGIYYSLALPISKRLFRYLDKNRYRKSRYEEAGLRMAYKLPLHYAYPSQVKQKLARAHEELLRHGYLTNVTYSLTQEGEDKVIYDFAEGGARMHGGFVIDAEVVSQLVRDFYRQ